MIFGKKFMTSPSKVERKFAHESINGQLVSVRNSVEFPKTREIGHREKGVKMFFEIYRRDNSHASELTKMRTTRRASMAVSHLIYLPSC